MTPTSAPTAGLPEILEELYLGPSPDYRDEVVAGAVRHAAAPRVDLPRKVAPHGRHRQPARVRAARPVARRRARARPHRPARWPPPWRSPARSQTPVPAPFGLARNGLIAWTPDGDIYTADPVTGVTRRSSPARRRTSTRCSRPTARDSRSRAVLEGADPPRWTSSWRTPTGRDPRVITTEPIPVDDVRFEWAPDSRSLIVDAPGDNGDLALRRDDQGATDRRRDRDLVLPPAVPAARREADPHRTADGRPVDSSLPSTSPRAPRRCSPRAAGDELGSARWSRDGSQVVYNARRPRTALAAAVRRQRRRHRHDPDHQCPGRLVRHRREVLAGRDEDRVHPLRAASTPTHGSSARRASTTSRPARSPRSARSPARSGSSSRARAMRTPRHGEGLFHEWSPDGTSLLAFESEGAGHPIVIDIATGTWHALDRISWRRARRPSSGSARHPDARSESNGPAGSCRRARCRVSRPEA